MTVMRRAVSVVWLLVLLVHSASLSVEDAIDMNACSFEKPSQKLKHVSINELENLANRAREGPCKAVQVCCGVQGLTDRGTNELIYVHNPKAASTTINGLLKSINNNAHRQVETKLCRTRETRNNTLFTTVRDPAERLVSGWTYVIRGNLDASPQLATQERFESFIEALVRGPPTTGRAPSKNDGTKWDDIPAGGVHWFNQAFFLTDFPDPLVVEQARAEVFASKGVSADLDAVLRVEHLVDDWCDMLLAHDLPAPKTNLDGSPHICHATRSRAPQLAHANSASSSLTNISITLHALISEGTLSPSAREALCEFLEVDYRCLHKIYQPPQFCAEAYAPWLSSP